MLEVGTSGHGLIRAYVDETGDRGVGPRASRYFAMCGLAVADEDDAARKLVAKFGHVRGVDHSDTLAYFEVKRAQAEPWVPWHLLSSPAQFVGAGAYLDMQAADQYAGMLGAALIPDELGGYEQHHLIAISHQIRRCDGRAWGYGFKVMGRPGCMESYPWWPTSGI